MCGRFALAIAPDALLRFIELVAHMWIFEDADAAAHGWRPRYNIAPTQRILVLAAARNRAEPTLEARRMTWGLSTPWGAPLINVRVETALQKANFKRAITERRCLVLADGWYEWTPSADGRPGTKQARLFRRRDRGCLPMAGIWQHDESGGGRAALLTKAASPLAATVHERMPLICSLEGARSWLSDPSLEPLLGSIPPDEALEIVPVGDRVSNIRHDDPSCQEPVAPDPPGAPDLLSLMREDG